MLDWLQGNNRGFRGRGIYHIPKKSNSVSSFLLALIMHALLFAFLWIGVSWKTDTQRAGVEAEIWDTTYREAAPKIREKITAPMPDTAPPETVETQAQKTPEADIALAEEKKRKELEKQKAAQEEKAKEEKNKEEKRKQDASQKQRDKLRAEEMKRMSELADTVGSRVSGSGGRGTALRSTGNNINPGYASKIGAKIRANTVFIVPANAANTPVEYEIRLLPDGTLRESPRKLKSSGMPAFDNAVLRAIEKSTPFPPDQNGRIPNYFILIHKPRAN